MRYTLLTLSRKTIRCWQRELPDILARLMPNTSFHPSAPNRHHWKQQISGQRQSWFIGKDILYLCINHQYTFHISHFGFGFNWEWPEKQMHKYTKWMYITDIKLLISYLNIYKCIYFAYTKRDCNSVVFPQKAPLLQHRRMQGVWGLRNLCSQRIFRPSKRQLGTIRIGHKRTFIALLKLNAKAASMTFIESPKRPL